MSASEYQFIIKHLSDTHTVLNLSGDLTIENSSSLHNEFLQKGLSIHTLSIVIQNVRNIDLSFVQLLIGCIQNRNQSQKLTFLEFDFDNATFELLEKTGCIETINSLQSVN